MRGTGLVTIGREQLYAFYDATGRAARLRVSVDECDRLDLFPGQQVRVRLPGRDSVGVLVTGVSHAPPFAWVEVEYTDVRTRAG